ncbi:response regulator [Erythrobacter insulae]|uniref:histidine kinase n=1 Tax=Erythrobacter insulae TaxID=2584124 RepID=A0A547PCG9_9SPHN|nr:CHASE domain-containing protein [Erythrobacter insulae]TRD11833.1 response regulator [Erythrobacter insulae]
MARSAEWFTRFRPTQQAAQGIVIVAITYMAIGLTGQLLILPSKHGMPIGLEVGVAIAALMLLGRNSWPGVWIGAFAVGLIGSHAAHLPGADLVAPNTLAAKILAASALATAAAGQGLLAEWLIDRIFGTPISLANNADVAKLALLAGPVACMASAPVGAGSLWYLGTIPASALLQDWIMGWIGDLIGIVLVLPIALMAPWRSPRVLWKGVPITPLTLSMVLGLFALVAATLAAWVVTKDIIYDRNLVAFSAMADDSEVALRHRVEIYRRSLDGGAAVVDGADRVTLEDWRDFIDMINVETLPGINGIGFIEPVNTKDQAAFLEQSIADGVAPFAIHPPGAGDDLFVIKYIEPIAINAQAVGLDIGFEKNRREAAEIARDTGEARITRRITLVQDEAQTPGFLLLRPVYRRGVLLSSVEDRRAAFRGWVYAPFIASRFIDGLTSSQEDLFTVKIYDGPEINPEEQIFGGESRLDAAFTISRAIPVEGQIWTVVWESTPTYESNVKTNEAAIVLGGGIALILCFGALLRSYARREAVISAEVKQKTIGLEKAVAALRESEHRFSDLARLSPAGIIRTDEFGFCIYANDTWLTMTDLGASSSMGSGWISAIHVDDRARFQSEWLEAIDRLSEHRSTFRFVHTDGTSRWADMVTRPEMTDTGEARGFIAVALDVTESMELQSNLQAARKQAEAAVEAKTSFLANMSHEIRTPMNGVLGFTNLLLGSELSEEQRRHTQLIADSGRSMMRLLNDILDLSKADAGQMTIASEPTNIHHVVTGTVTLMAALADEKGVALDCDIASDVPRVIRSDGLRIRQILLNLLGNALKFTSKGRVTLRARLETGDASRLVLEVEDTGIGIAKDRQDVIFSEFEQANASIAREHGGTGLGLAISRKLTQLMGGEVEVESVLGTGSVFRIRLPVINCHDDQSQGEARLNPELEIRRAPRIPRCCRILLVEDHDINQMLMKDMLNRLGKDVQIAENGAIAVEEVKASIQANHPFDLVLMDMNMPVMNGIEATRAIRSEGIKACDLPIVALTANAFAEDMAGCLEAGMQAHLTKPINSQKLEEAIATWAKRSNDHAAPIPSPPRNARSDLSIEERYRAEKQKMIESLETLLHQGEFRQESRVSAARKLHNLAGTAGIFGEEQLGEQARALEHDLRAGDGGDARDRIGGLIANLRASEMVG